MCYLALLHDVCDHKYPEAISRAELTVWIRDNIPEYVKIDDMIEQLSFSVNRRPWIWLTIVDKGIPVLSFILNLNDRSHLERQSYLHMVWLIEHDILSSTEDRLGIVYTQ